MVSGPPYKGPGSIPPKRCPYSTNQLGCKASTLLHSTQVSPLGGGWWSPAVWAFGGGSPVREVGTSSCWAPPPSRQPQCGSAAPCHGRLGAWDIHPLALGRQSAGGGPPPTWTVARGNPRLHHQRITSCWGKPAHPSHHCDALEVRTPDRSDPVKDVTGWPANPKLVRHPSSQLFFGRVYMWMRPSWDSQYTRTKTEEATTPYYD